MCVDPKPELSDADAANIAFEAASNAIPGGLTQRAFAMLAQICLDQADLNDLANAVTEAVRR